jgi:hypothetical protein
MRLCSRPFNPQHISTLAQAEDGAWLAHFFRDALYISFFCITGMASMMTAFSVGDRACPSRWQVSCSMEALQQVMQRKEPQECQAACRGYFNE